jgi:spermidine synthase
MQLWCTEEELDGGVRYGYRAKDVLFSKKSEFQQIDIVETQTYGRMLLIDGFVMTTDVDEFVYHEMIAHIPALHHGNPKRVVVIGGGDGGTVRELLKHPSIEEIVLCEIDGMVVDACREFFPKLAGTLDDPRVKVKIGDGLAYMREHKAKTLDMVLVDSTDPIGPGEGLFSREFYRSVASSLKDGGVMAAQSESPWYPKEALVRITNNIQGGFQHFYPYVGPVPTYPRGCWSWTMAANHQIEIGKINEELFHSLAPSLRYLERDVVNAVFALPKFFRTKIKG